MRVQLIGRPRVWKSKRRSAARAQGPGFRSTPDPVRRRHANAALVAATVITLAGCGAGARLPSAAPVAAPRAQRAAVRISAGPSGSACVRAGAAKRAKATLRATEHRQQQETDESVIHSELRRIARDGVLVHDLSVGDLGAALAEADRLLVRHVVRMRVVRGARILVDANPTSFSVAGAAKRLRTHGGRMLGRLEITIQDVIGFIKLTYRHDGAAATVVRAQGGRTLTNLAAAGRARLPASGCVEVAKSAYVVRSFHTTSFTGRPLTVWLLTKP